MDETRVSKVPAAMEDLACGTSKVFQQRAGSSMQVTQIDMHYAVESEVDLRKVDITKYRYAKLGELAYRFDAAATSGIPSDFGPGYWVVSALPSEGVSHDDQPLNEYLVAENARLNKALESVGISEGVFSAKLVKTVDGWNVLNKNKVVDVVVKDSGLEVELTSTPLTLSSVGLDGVVTQHSIDSTKLNIVLSRKLSGKVNLKDATLELDQDGWSSTVSATRDDTTGLVTIAHPASATVLDGVKNKHYSAAQVSVTQSKILNGSLQDAVVTDYSDKREIQGLASLSVLVSYNTTLSDFEVVPATNLVGASKGSNGVIVLTHTNLSHNSMIAARSDNYIANATIRGANETRVRLKDFSGVVKTLFDVDSSFYFNNPELVTYKVDSDAKVNFDFGYVVMPADEFEVGTEIYLTGLVEV